MRLFQWYYEMGLGLLFSTPLATNLWKNHSPTPMIKAEMNAAPNGIPTP